MTAPSFDEFVACLSREFGRDRQLLVRTAKLDHDLGFDSAELMELVLMMETIAGTELSESVLPEVDDLGELYDYLAMVVARQSDSGGT